MATKNKATSNTNDKAFIEKALSSGIFKPASQTSFSGIFDKDYKTDKEFTEAINDRISQSYAKYGNSPAFRQDLMDIDEQFKKSKYGTDSSKYNILNDISSNVYTESYLAKMQENPSIANYNSFVALTNDKSLPFNLSEYNGNDSLATASAIMYKNNKDFNMDNDAYAKKIFGDEEKNISVLENQKNEKTKKKQDKSLFDRVNDLGEEAGDMALQAAGILLPGKFGDNIENKFAERRAERQDEKDKEANLGNEISALNEEIEYRKSNLYSQKKYYELSRKSDFEKNSKFIEGKTPSLDFGDDKAVRMGLVVSVPEKRKKELNKLGYDNLGYTPEQKKVAYYMANTQGKDAAQEYIDNLKGMTSVNSANYLKIRDGEHIGTKMGYQVLAGMESLYNIPTEIKNTFTVNTEYKTADTTTSVADMMVSETKGAEKIILGSTRGIIELAPSLAITAATGGAGAPSIIAKLGRIAAKGLFAGNVYAKSYREAVNSGNDWSTATGFGLGSVGLELGLEQLSGITLGGTTPKVSFGGKVASKFDDIFKSSPKLRAVASTAGRLVENYAGEFTEEYLADVFNPVLRNVFLGENNEFKVYDDEFVESGLIGGFTGAVLGSPSFVTNIARTFKPGNYGANVAFYNTAFDGVLENEMFKSNNKVFEGMDKEQKSEAINRYRAEKIYEAAYDSIFGYVSQAVIEGNSVDDVFNNLKKEGIDTAKYKDEINHAYDVASASTGPSARLTAFAEKELAKGGTIGSVVKALTDDGSIIGKISEFDGLEGNELTKAVRKKVSSVQKESGFLKTVNELINKGESTYGIFDNIYERGGSFINAFRDADGDVNTDDALRTIENAQKNAIAKEIKIKNLKGSDAIKFMDDAMTRLEQKNTEYRNNAKATNNKVNAINTVSESVLNSIKTTAKADASLSDINTAVSEAIITSDFSSENFTGKLASIYTDALRSKNANAYIAVSQSGIDIPDALITYKESGTIPENVNSNAFKAIGDAFNGITESAITQVEAARTALANDVADSASEGKNGAGEAENAPVEEVVSWSEEDIKDISTEEREKTQKTLEGMGYNGEREYNRIMKAVNKSPNKSTKVFDAFRTAFAYLYEHGYKNEAFDPAKVKILGVKNIERIFNAGAKDKTAKQAVKRKDKGVVIKDAAYKAAKLSKREAKMLDGIAAITGRDIRFDATLPGNAKIDLNTGEIVISTTANTGSAWAMIHEVFHAMSVSVPAEARLLKNTILDIVRKNSGAFKALLNKYVNVYGNELLDENGKLREDAYQYVTEEMVCDLLGYVVSRPDILSTITGEQRNVIQRFIDRLVSYFTSKDILNELGLSDEVKSAFLEVGKEAKAIAEMFRKALEAEQVQAEAMPQVKEAEKKTSDKEVKKSKDLSDSTITESVEIDLSENNELASRIQGLEGSQKYKAIRDFIIESIGNDEFVLSDGIKAKIDKSDALHIANKSANRKTAYIAKIKELISTAKLHSVKTDVIHNKFDEFRYYKANVKYGDEVYPIYLNVGKAKNGDGYHLYDITKKIGDFAKHKNALERVEKDLRSEIESPTNYYTQDNENVNTKNERESKDISETDSEGKTLTPEQAEYFKDSLVRDDNGNLLKVYHGSGSEFTVFNHKHLNTHGNAHGRGFYFTDKKSLAEGYSEDGGQLLEGYLNITKPLAEDKVTIKKADLVKLIKATCKAEAQEYVADGEYETVAEALPDTWISNYVNTYRTNLNDAYREVADIIYSGNDNDVEIIAEITNAGAGNENTLKLTKDVLGYDGVIYTADDGTHEFVSLVSEQFKNADNVNPTANPDVRWSKDISESLDGKQMSESKIKSLAGRLRRSYRSKFEKDELISSLSDIYTMLAEQRYEDAKTASQSLAERMLDEVKDDVIVNDAAKDILNDIRGTKVWFNDKQIAEAKHYYGNLWHEKFFGKVIVSKEAKTSLDQQWQEWCEKYPDYFKSDVIDANMPIKLIEIIEGLKREKHTVVKPDISDAVIPLATDIYNGVWNSAVRRKLTDEEKASIAELKGAGKGLTSQQKLDLIKAVRQDELKRWGVALGMAENADTGSRMSLSEIIKKVEESFGINITHGSDATVKKEGVSGAYNYDSKTVRTKLRNDLPSIAHAIGYHIDNKLKLIDDIIDQTQAVRVQNGDGEGIYETELKRLAGDFTSAKGSREMIREGFAEFIRTYLASKPLAMEAAGNFYSYFESKLKEDEKLLNAVNEAADTIGKYFAQGYEERAGAAIITQKEWEKLNKPKGKEKLNVIRNGINKWLFDRFYGIKQAEKNNEMFDLTTSDNAWVKATLSLNSTARASRILDDGFFDSNGNRVGEGFYEIIKDLGDTESTKFKAFSEYLGYVHALEWVAPNKVVIDGKDFTATKKPVFADAHLNDLEVLKGLIAKAEKNNPDFKPTAERLYKYQDNLMEYYLIPSGAMSKEQADKFRKQYPHYVPFNRFNTVLGGGKPKTNVFANLSNPIKLATGGNAEIRNPIESIINSTFAAVDFKAKNDTMLSLINEFTNGVFPGTMERIYSTKELEKLEEKGKNPFAMEEDARLNESKNASYSPVIDKDKGIVYAWVNGEKRFYQIYDKELYNAVANLDVKNLGALLRFLNTIGNAMKTTMTMKNPLFALGNFYRDFMTFHYNSTADVNLISHLAMYIGAFKSMIIKDQYYQRYKALGGMDTGRFLADLDAISRSATVKKLNTKKWSDVHSVKDAYKKFTKNQNILKYLWNVLWEKAFTLNDAFEAAPRLAEFKYTMQKTSDSQLAMFRANDVTTNFARSGIAGRHLNSIFLFSNASLQGFDKMVRTYTDAKYVKKSEDGKFDKNRLAKVIIKNVTWSVILAALQSFLNRRDEEAEEAYNNLSEFTKNNYDVFYVGDGKFFKLPKEQNLAIPRTFIQRIMDATQGDGVDWRELGDYIWSALTPGFVPDLSEVYTLDLPGVIHGVVNNTAIGVITDVGFNRDYKDDEIVPSYMSGANYEKYYPYTSSFSVKFAKKMFDASGGAIDVSPIAIDHYMSAGGYYGSLYKKLFPYTDVEEKGIGGSIVENAADAIGLNTKFVVDNTYSTDILDNFYEGRELAEKKLGIDDSAENKIISAKYQSVGTFISKYNKASKNGTGDQQRLDRRMLIEIINGYDGSELTEGEKYLIHVLDETQNEDLLKLNYPSNEFKSKQFKVNGEKFKTEVSLGANEYAQMCSEIDSARAKALLFIKSYGFSEEEAAVYIVDAFKAIDEEYEAKYLDLYGKDVKVEVEEKIVSSKDKEKVREEVLGNVIPKETTK